MERRTVPIPHLPTALPLDTGNGLTCGHPPLAHGIGICFGGTLACPCTAYTAPEGEDDGCATPLG
jgi:hypothetical protein